MPRAGISASQAGLKNVCVYMCLYVCVFGVCVCMSVSPRHFVVAGLDI